MKKIILIFLLSLIYSQSIFATALEKTSQEKHFLVLSDIHFDPYLNCRKTPPCSLINKLRKAPVSEWTTIFEQEDKLIPQYGNDTNFRLWRSSLSSIKSVSSKIKIEFGMILGDFLAHDFRENYIKFTRDVNPKGYQSFVNKMLRFLSQDLKNTFPDINFYPAVGNNDSYHGDYHTLINGNFFKDTAVIWGNLMDAQSKERFQSEFRKGGYYSLPISTESRLQLIALNTNLFSKNRMGRGLNQAALQQLNWLEKELSQVAANHQKALIIMHIPLGIDVYATLRFRLFRITEFWEKSYVDAYQALLNKYSAHIMGIFAGHLHADWFQILVLQNEVPITGVPALSPIFATNPAYKLYRYSTDNFALNDYTTYFLPLNSRFQQWNTEYSFKETYLQDCKKCSLYQGMYALKQNKILFSHYQRFYSASSDRHPILKKGIPYWCAINKIQKESYSECLVEEMK